MRGPLARELQRKSFHMLSLVYLAAFKLLGWPGVLEPMLAWALVVIVVETWRLRSRALNEALTSFFGGLARDDEGDKYSGIFHTTLGVLVVLGLFGSRPAVVAAAIYCVAFGDAAAALVGKTWGRHRLMAGKSWEGTLACLAASLISCRLTGFSWGCAALAALVATTAEAMPTTRYYNDNFWMPVVTGIALGLCAGS
jgi:dolichol kinase